MTAVSPPVHQADTGAPFADPHPRHRRARRRR